MRTTLLRSAGHEYPDMTVNLATSIINLLSKVRSPDLNEL